MHWQPGESAKDGSYVLMYWRNGQEEILNKTEGKTRMTASHGCKVHPNNNLTLN